MSHRDVLLSWLNDAYAMENALVPILQNHAKDAKDYPTVQMRMQEHVQETLRHADLVKGCIERLGESPSTTKSLLGSLLGMGQAPVTGVFGDELVKNVIIDFATEHFEIACYEALIAAAQECGEPECLRVCQQILKEERDMAEWLHQQLPTAAQNYCRQAAASHAT